nr:MAG TPA: hypothetical protein [Caudoviricetes sp.]
MHTSDNGDCTKLKPLTGVECVRMAKINDRMWRITAVALVSSFDECRRISGNLQLTCV